MSDASISSPPPQPSDPQPPEPQPRADGVLTRERLKAVCLSAFTVLTIWLCYRMARPFSPALTWAVALAVIWRRAHHRIVARIRFPTVAAAASVTLVTVLLAGPVAGLSYQFGMQASTYVASLENADRKQINDRVNDVLDRHERLEPVLRWLRKNVDLEKELMTAAAAASRQAPSFVSGTAWIVMQTLIALLVLFYFFRDESDILRSLRRLLPLSMDETEFLFARVDDTIHATIVGSLSVAAVQGAMGGLMFWWLGLPAPLLWGLVMGLLAVVPNLGTFLVWGPAALLLALSGDIGKAILLTAWGMVAIGLIDNLLYPILVGNRMRLHPLVVLFAVLGGLTVFGTSGIILGPVTIALLLATLEVWRRRTIGGEAADQPTELSTVPLPTAVRN